jgi:hypothetical protein
VVIVLVAIRGYSIGGCQWLSVAILLMVNGGYYINATGGYSINGY